MTPAMARRVHSNAQVAPLGHATRPVNRGRLQTISNCLVSSKSSLPVGEGNEGKGLMARQALSPSLSQRERETTLLIIRNPLESETGRITEPCNAPVVRAPESSVVIRTLRFFCAWEDARNFSATTAVWNSKGSSGRPNSNGSPLRQMNRTQGAGALPDTVLTYPLRSD